MSDRSMGDGATRPAGTPALGRALLAVLAGALLLSACSSGGAKRATASSSPSVSAPSSSSAAPSGPPKGTVTFAEFPASVPNYIFPLPDPAHAGSPNTEQFSYLMWRPLYWTGTGSGPQVDMAISLAYPPQFLDGGRVVQVHLRHYVWSDGKPVTSRDVQFAWNLIKANKDDWASYVKGEIPDNVTSFKIVNATTFRMTLNQAYSHQWFTDNELSLIVPLPQQAWDRESAKGAVGNYDMSTSGAKKVWSFLSNQAKSSSTYATNPLWQVVDGPWKLTGFTSNGRIAFTANPRYSGPVKPHIKNFVELPFTTDSAEFNTLLGGSIDYGYIPFNDLKAQQARMDSMGYHLSDWNLWTINYIAINYNNPKAGPIFHQLYFRQALESLVDQKQIIKTIFYGQGVPTFGPIPVSPPNPYVSVKTNPNPYNPKRALALLRAHGWAVRPGGVTTCVRPGTGSHQCGAGIPRGTPLSFTAIVNNGNRPVDLEMESFKSSWSQIAGIQLNVRLELFTTVISQAFGTCTSPSQSSCSWQMANWGGGSNDPPYPTPEATFSSGGAENAGHYSNPRADALINASHLGGLASLHAVERYLAGQVPVIWVPNLSYQLSEIRNNLKGADQQNPYIGLTPENWYFTGKG